MKATVRLILFALFVFAVNVAASGSSQQNAIAIISVLGLVLPFLYKYVPAAGKYMVAITLVVSIIAAAVAEVLSGEVNISNLQANPSLLYLSALSVYGLSQFIFATLKQSPKTLNLVS